MTSLGVVTPRRIFSHPSSRKLRIPFRRAAAVMTYLFPSDAQALNNMANDAGNSTFDALIHTQLDVKTGLTLGGQVGQQVVAKAQADGAN